jgi:hypothetical protein
VGYSVNKEDAVQSIAYAATITPDVQGGDYVKVGTLTGNITINNPVMAEGGTIPSGARLTLDLTQDGTGSRTVTLGNAFAAGQYVASTAANARDIVEFRYDGTQWNLVNVTKPVRAGAAQAAVATTAATNSSPYGYSQAQADAIVALVNELRAAMVAAGLIKGAA